LIELVLKIFSEGFTPWRFIFKQRAYLPGEPTPTGWNRIGDLKVFNMFDMCIVVGGMLPSDIMGGSNDAILIMRLLRLLLVMKMAKKFPKLQLVVLTLIEGAGTILTALLLFALMLGLFAIVGCSVFRRNDPWHFGTFDRALITLVRAATFDDWTDVMYLNMYGCKNWVSADFGASDCVQPESQWTVSVIFFCFFVLVSNMVSSLLQDSLQFIPC
jgi:voltage-gated sodium channel